MAEEVGAQTEEVVVVREALWSRTQLYQLVQILASSWDRAEVLLLQVRAPKFLSPVLLLLLPVVAKAAAECTLTRRGRLVEEMVDVVEEGADTSLQPEVRASKAEPEVKATMMISGQLALEEEALGKQGQAAVAVWREMVVMDISFPLPRSCQNLLQVGALEL